MAETTMTKLADIGHAKPKGQDIRIGKRRRNDTGEQQAWADVFASGDCSDCQRNDRMCQHGGHVVCGLTLALSGGKCANRAGNRKRAKPACDRPLERGVGRHSCLPESLDGVMLEASSASMDTKSTPKRTPTRSAS